MNRINCLIFITIFSLIVQEANSKKGSTVGDLLKKIDKQAELKKGASSLPQFNQVTTKEAPRQVNLKSVKPPTTSKMYYDADSDEKQLIQITDAGIDQLYKLTQKFKNSSKRGELWLRLAELYVEKARIIEFNEYNRFDKQMELYDSKKIKSGN